MKPRLLVILNRFVIGGPAADTIPLLYHLQDKYTIKILYGEKEADEREPLFLLKKYPGLNLIKIASLKRSINPFSDVIAFFSIVGHILKFSPHIVHTHGAKSGFAGRLAARLWSKAAIVHTFHGHVFYSYFNPFTTRFIITLEKMLAHITNAAVALGASQKHDLIHTFRIFPPEKVVEIPLGLQKPEQPLSDYNHFRNTYKLKPGDVSIAIIGRLVPIKNHIDFIKVGSEVLKKVDNVKFFIIGDGQQRAGLVHFLKENKLSFALPGQPSENRKFIFTSWIDDIYTVMHNLDIVVLTSYNEGTPLSLIEAQLCGKSVVAYDVGGVKDTFVDNVSGYLVPKGDIFSFSEKLISMISDKDKRLAMGEKGKEFSSAKFSKLVEVNRTDKLYTGLLKNNGSFKNLL